MVSETEPDYLKNNYSDSKMIFARDAEGEAFYSLLGGRGTYPYTVVLDENGIITNIFFEALHYEDLKEAVEASK